MADLEFKLTTEVGVANGVRTVRIVAFTNDHEHQVSSGGATQVDAAQWLVHRACWLADKIADDLLALGILTQEQIEYAIERYEQKQVRKEAP